MREALPCGAHAAARADQRSEESAFPVCKEQRTRRSQDLDVLAGHGLVGTSAAMETLGRMIRRVADSDGPALIQGPTGSGKELVARAIHALSPRRHKPLVSVNCSAFMESLAEAQLFGHEKGYFTGADKARVGFLAEVGSGTLFLDEIAELALPLQAKLLRVLENRTFRVLGAATDSRFEGRVVAATHVELDTRRKEGRFREDLYYRLEVLRLRVPSLDDRKDDIPDLAECFVRDLHRPLTLSDGAKKALMTLSWPGNVRELRNLVHRLAVFVEGNRVEAADVYAHKGQGPEASSAPGAHQHAPSLLSGISIAGTKKQNTMRLMLNQIHMLEAEGKSIEEICRIMDMSRSSFFRLKPGLR